MSIETVPFTEYFDFAPKSKRKSGDGLEEGAYPFFVSSQTLIKRTNEPDYEGEALVFGTGGNPSVHYTSGKFSTSGDCLVAFPKKNKEAARAVNYYLRGNIHLLEEGFKGAGLKHISKKYISALKVPKLEALNVDNLAYVLDKADSIRKKRRKAYETLDELLRATFLDIFGDPADKDTNEFIKVEKCLLDPKTGIQSGPFGSALKKHEYTSSGIPAWAMDNIQTNVFLDEPRLFITQEKFDGLKRYSAQNGDILISRAGTVGRMAVFESKYSSSLITTNLVRVRLNTEIMLPEYFSFLFSFFKERLGSLKVNEKDNAFSFLNPTKLRTTLIPKPDLAQQKKFVQFMSSQKLIIEKLSAQEIQADLLFKSLTQKAFEGAL